MANTSGVRWREGRTDTLLFTKRYFIDPRNPLRTLAEKITKQQRYNTVMALEMLKQHNTGKSRYSLFFLHKLCPVKFLHNVNSTR